MLDVIMLAVSGGRERTASQFSELPGAPGFGAGTLIETAGALRMVETTAV
jgi:C-methyltransferase